MIGRIMRSCEGKTGAVVLDHAGNHHAHGLVTRRLEYSLTLPPKSTESEPLGLRTCPECFRLVDCVRPDCPECGHVFTAAERPEVVTIDGELVEFDEDSFAYRAAMWGSFEEQRLAAGYKSGWAKFRYHERFGVWPLFWSPVPNGPSELINPAKATMEQKQFVWLQLEEKRCEKGFKSGWTGHRYKQIFGVWPKGVMTPEGKLTRLWEKQNA